MQLNIKKLLLGLLFVLFGFIVGFVLWLWFTTHAVEEVEVFSDQVTVHVGQIKQIIKDVYPDPSWLRFNIASENPDIVKIKDKYTVDALKEGSAVINCLDKKRIIKQIEVTVVPYYEVIP